VVLLRRRLGTGIAARLLLSSWESGYGIPSNSGVIAIVSAIRAAIGLGAVGGRGSRAGFSASRPPAGPHQHLAVCDTAGLSTELAFGTAADGVERTYCFDTGALRIADAVSA
jgi:hypothetical protein